MIIVDRIEGGSAVCIRDNASMEIPLSEIDGGVREGDVLRIDESGMRYIVDAEETERRRQSISERFNRLKKPRS